MNHTSLHYLLITLIMSTFFLSSCSPTYTTRNEYIPPTAPQALACLSQCDAKMNSCQNSCDAKKQTCLLQAKQTASLTLPTKETEYTSKLERYITEKRYYDLERDAHYYQLERLERNYDLYHRKCKDDQKFCSRHRDIKRELRHLRYSSRLQVPTRPVKPTLASEIKHHQASCSSDCGCQLRYNSCYTSCGGRIIPHQICTKNCPEKNNKDTK